MSISMNSCRCYRRAETKQLHCAANSLRSQTVSTHSSFWVWEPFPNSNSHKFLSKLNICAPICSEKWLLCKIILLHAYLSSNISTCFFLHSSSKTCLLLGGGWFLYILDKSYLVSTDMEKALKCTFISFCQNTEWNTSATCIERFWYQGTVAWWTPTKVMLWIILVLTCTKIHTRADTKYRHQHEKIHWVSLALKYPTQNAYMCGKLS